MMSDDELELMILRRYAARHEQAEIADPEQGDKCLRELDLREVLREVAGLQGPQLEYQARRWFPKLAPPNRMGHRQGPLRRCSGPDRDVKHQYHARAFFATAEHDVSVWDRINELEKIVPANADEKREARVPNDETVPRVFISHASSDSALAARVADLLKAALTVPAKAIRCTSVDGYRLRGGAETDQQLRRELREAETFVGILSARSVRSHYVLIELGARWVLEKHLLPLLAPGTDASVIGGPLKGINALHADNASQLQQMVEEMAGILRVTPDRGSAYQRHVEAVIGLGASYSESAEDTDSIPQPRLSADPRGWIALLGEGARELLLEAVKSQNGEVMAIETNQGFVVEANGRKFVEQGNVRSEAKWRGAVKELRAIHCVEDPGGRGEVFRVTDRGFSVAELLERSPK